MYCLTEVLSLDGIWIVNCNRLWKYITCKVPAAPSFSGPLQQAYLTDFEVPYLI